MKKQFIIFGIITLLIAIGLSGCIGPTASIRIKKLDKAPVVTFINMTEEQMQKFTLLKETILTKKTIERSSPSYEIERVNGVLRYFDTNIIKYQNEYYEIRTYYAD